MGRTGQAIAATGYIARDTSFNHQWELGEAALYPEDRYWQHSSWKFLEDSPGPRQVIYRSLWQLLQPLPESERRKVLGELLVWASAEGKGRLTHRTLSQQEVAILVSGGLIEAGAHTVTHPMLSAFSVVLQGEEIQQCKASIEKILGYPVMSFAYPFGNYTVETVPIVRETGFTCVCSTLAGTVERDADRFQLLRVQVEDWDGEEFSQRLSKWFHESSLV